MTATYDYEHLHHLVDQMPPEKARHLELLLESDSPLPPFATEPDDAQAAEAEQSRGRGLSFAGIGDSGRSDLSERHRELIQDAMRAGE